MESTKKTFIIGISQLEIRKYTFCDSSLYKSWVRFSSSLTYPVTLQTRRLAAGQLSSSSGPWCACEDFDPGTVDEQQQDMFFLAKEVFQASINPGNNNTGQTTHSLQIPDCHPGLDQSLSNLQPSLTLTRPGPMLQTDDLSHSMAKRGTTSVSQCVAGTAACYCCLK